MFIFKKDYKKLLNDLKNKDHEIESLKKDLSHARDLRAILEKLYPIKLFANGLVFDGSCELRLPDNVLVYTEDLLGGKVIKQEGNKAIVIDKEGNVKTGLAKQKRDKGYAYKLVRE